MTCLGFGLGRSNVLSQSGMEELCDPARSSSFSVTSFQWGVVRTARKFSVSRSTMPCRVNAQLKVTAVMTREE